MKLAVFNGSGRGVKSNTTLLVTRFMLGFESIEGNTAQLLYLKPLAEEQQEQTLDAFLSADVVLLAFPLYVDAMPGMVKAFIETLKPICGKQGNPSIAYFVHSGFPEALHSRYVERYLVKLSKRLGCSYAGTMVRGGTEGIQIMSDKMTRSIYGFMEQAGKDLGTNGSLSTDLIDKIAGRERYPALTGLFLPILTKLGLTTGYWDQQLKKNKAFHKRDNRPYQTE